MTGGSIKALANSSNVILDCLLTQYSKSALICSGPTLCPKFNFNARRSSALLIRAFRSRSSQKLFEVVRTFDTVNDHEDLRLCFCPFLRCRCEVSSLSFVSSFGVSFEIVGVGRVLSSSFSSLTSPPPSPLPSLLSQPQRTYGAVKRFLLFATKTDRTQDPTRFFKVSRLRHQSVVVSRTVRTHE